MVHRPLSSLTGGERSIAPIAPCFLSLMRLNTPLFLNGIIHLLKIILKSQHWFSDHKWFFLCFWLCWVFVPVHGLSLVMVNSGYSSFRCAGFSLSWLLLLRSTGSRCRGFSTCSSQVLECRLRSCGTRAQLLQSMWNLYRPGIKPEFPALAGGFLSIVLPGKSH